MAPSDYSIPPGSLVLVTGANGYIGSHIVDVLLELGYNVRGTVRDKKPWLDQFFEGKYGKGRFESIVVPAMEGEGAFAAAAEGTSGVIHVASDGTFTNEPDRVISAVTNGTINALKAASTQSSVKRFVLTSSSVAVIIPETNKKGVVVDESTWNDDVVKLAWSGAAPESAAGYVVYSASKTEGERAAWKWVEENEPNFVLNAILPNCNFGRVLIPEHMHGSTMGFVRKFFRGDFSVMDIFPPQYFVDVRDNARLHVAALLDPNVKGERIFAFAREYNWTDVLTILRKLRPDQHFPDNPENEGRDYTEVTPRDRAEKLLQGFYGQTGWTSLEDSLAAGIEDIK
ncbi:cinnamoyl- reductase [Trichoderma arundinaceum]|uniref:Cinnamoyl-reductase n=1 Tax=Trichoderma arundinaceum TaxID=490622 RepID=A0A395NN16_TRIAR|nr:cinnamoyl- reductase [Trichoderma arundinaceum]